MRLLTVALWIGCLAVPATATDDLNDKGLHGAASMNAQQRALDGLLGDVDPMAAPAGMDPGVWASYIEPGDEPTPARVALGRRLYFDLRLSADGTVSCATCHDVTRGFTDQRMVSEGIRGQLGRRNAPTTLNAALIEPQFLDGRARNVEHQAGMPILNPIEMGHASEAEVVAAVKAIPDYPALFREAYERDVEYEDIGRAIGAFERSLIFLDAPFDRFVAGDEDAISDIAKKGHDLFNGQARCVTCHPIHASNPLGSNFNFHNIGVAARTQDFEALAKRALKALAEDDSEVALDRLALGTDMSELGRFMITRNRSDIGAFKTPQLRNIGITFPYMHDGSMQTLWDVVDHYNKGGEDNPFLDGGVEPLALDDEQIDQLVAFLFTLTDVRFADENRAAMAAQRGRSVQERPFKDEDLAFRRKINFEDRVFGSR